MGRTINQYYCEDCHYLFLIKGWCKNVKCPCCKSKNVVWEASSLKLYLANERMVAKK